MKLSINQVCILFSKEALTWKKSCYLLLTYLIDAQLPKDYYSKYLFSN